MPLSTLAGAATGIVLGMSTPAFARNAAIVSPVGQQDPGEVQQSSPELLAAPTPEEADLAPGFAEQMDVQTSMRAGVWSHDRNLNQETNTPVFGLRVRAAPRIGAIDGSAESFVQLDSVDGAEGDLVVGWLRLTMGNLEIKAGRQVVVWGRADRLNPTDNISSRDYTLLVANDDDQRRGNAMVQGRLGLGPYTLDAYWLPEFRPNRFPLDRSRPGVALVANGRTDSDNQFALKLDRSGGRVDWSVSWFRGVDRTRDFTATAFNPPGALVEVQETFPGLDVLGVDFAGVGGAFGYRVEVAYTNVRGRDSIYRKNSNVWAVAGVDTTLASGWNLNLQYSFRRVFNYSDPRDILHPIQRAVAIQSAVVGQQLDRTQNGLTFRVARKWLQDTLDFELATIAYLETRDAAIRPKLTYAINDRARISAGGDIFLGPSRSYFGRVRSLTGGYLQLNIGF